MNELLRKIQIEVQKCITNVLYSQALIDYVENSDSFNNLINFYTGVWIAVMTWDIMTNTNTDTTDS